MKLGIILFIIGAVLAIYLSKVKIEKSFLTKVGTGFGIILLLYGLILIIQPEEDKYVKFTETTISKPEVKKENKQ